MKTLNLVAGCLLYLAAPSLLAAPVAEQKQWTERYAVSSASPQLEISNIWGSVKVRPGKSGEIVVSVAEFRRAPNQQLFERSMEIYKLDTKVDALGVSIIVGERNNRWHGNNPCKDCRVDYQFDIEVPPGTRLDVGTVMDGKVDIAGITGSISASNVNGPIEIDGVENCTAINSVNGAVNMGFSRAPAQDCSIETINGNIHLDVPADSGMDVALDLWNGEVSSDFAVQSLVLPATVEQVVADGRTRYRIQQLTGMRVGPGGPLYSIASMNGDVRITKQN
jgi:hypothetical protein